MSRRVPFAVVGSAVVGLALSYALGRIIPGYNSNDGPLLFKIGSHWGLHLVDVVLAAVAAAILLVAWTRS